MSEEKRKHETCFECRSELELYEMDLKKDIRIMQCKGCGLFHLFKRDLFSWKIIKVSKDVSHLLY